ncbi:flagellar filament capping protein FliD [Carnobacteriaceae bacterium 52-44]
MSSINFMGSYSGIDMSVIDQMIEAERAKGVKFTNQKQKIEREKNAWKDINTRLDSLFNKLDTLTKKETFESRTVSSNVKESTSLSVTAGENAAVGQYRVQVQQLATSTRLTGGKINTESIYDELNLSGEFSFIVDGKAEPFTIQIDSEDSLRDITNKINGLTVDSGIQASIVDNRLVLMDTNMGESSIEVQIDGDGVASGLGFNKQTQSVSGQPAIFTIDGLTIERNTNTIDDVIEGLAFKLSNVHQGADNEIITIASDTEKTTKAVKDFVEQYNSIMNQISSQMDVGDPSLEDNTTGALTGDGTLMRLQSGLRSLMTRNLEGDFSGDFKNIEDLGITLDRDGVASFDEVTFNEALQNDPANVARFFYTQERVTETVGEGEEATTTSRFEKNGMSELLKNFVDTYISSSTGIISTKNETYDKMLKDINEQIDTFNERVDKKRDRYIQQFTALDTAMMQAQSQLDYLYSQLGLGNQE